MASSDQQGLRIGWIGAGRMGFELAARLLRAGCDVTVWNRTRSKAEPLEELGAAIADTPAELASCDIVFTMVAGPEDFKQVTIGEGGVLTARDDVPSVLVDSSTVSADASEEVRRHAAERGTAVLAAPVSGNPKVVKAGRLTVVASGPPDAFEIARPYLELFGQGVTYVGEGDSARLVKLCHNLMLGIVAQTLAEITVLAEKGGVERSRFLEFLNASVMGSTFSRYKTPALVNLDFTPTFTPVLLRKDFDLGLEAADDLGASLPLAEYCRKLVQNLIDQGYVDVDFASMIEVQARAAGMKLEPEGIAVSDGLEPAGTAAGDGAPAESAAGNAQ
jgi:3-hydroxyisobutyrate dehydrogenase-like beta-hydroxyacid dehydrogenase